MLSNEKLYPIVTELFMRDLKLNISPVFIAQSYFAVPKNIRLNSQAIFLWTFQTNENFGKLHLIIHQTLNFKTLSIYIKMYCKTIFFLVIDITLTSDSSSHFKENILERI